MGIFGRNSSRTATVEAAGLATEVEQGAQVVDVRTREEWVAGHLPFARHIPLDELGPRAGELDKDTRTIFICRSGQRSQAATDAFSAHGYDVANLDGGMKAAKRAGLPVVTDDGAEGWIA